MTTKPDTSESIGACAICHAPVERDSCYEWTDCDRLLCHACSAMHETSELRELGFEVSE